MRVGVAAPGDSAGVGAAARAAGRRSFPPSGSAPENLVQPSRRRAALNPAWVLAVHEGGHAVVGRCLGLEVAGATIVAGCGYDGLVWRGDGPPDDLDAADATHDRTCLAVRSLMRPVGESRADASAWLHHVHTAAIGLLAGYAAERRLGVPAGAARIAARRDLVQARALAATIVYDEAAINSFLAYAQREAVALVNKYWCSVRCVATELLKHSTLTGAQIDRAIFSGLVLQDLARERRRRRSAAVADARAARLHVEPPL